LHLLAKQNVQEWSKLMMNEWKEKQELQELDKEQVRLVFLVMLLFPSVQQQLVEDPNFILATDFQQKIDQLQINSSISFQPLRDRSSLPASNQKPAPEVEIPQPIQPFDNTDHQRKDTISMLLKELPPPIVEHKVAPDPLREESLVIVLSGQVLQTPNEIADNDREKEGDLGDQEDSESGVRASD
ncbi:hypothetical protein RFI_08566, partial [Reticulomyxa filosa]